MADEIRSVAIGTIAHAEQRYDTCGDWETQDGALAVSVSEVGDWRMQMCVAVHELIEALICVHRGVSQGCVDAFDIAYEKQRPEGDFSEPGDCVAAPYYAEHQVASAVERLLARELGVDWAEYEARLRSLVYEEKEHVGT